MPSPRTFTGSYQRSDDQVTFDYSVTIARAEAGTVWFSRVSVADTLRGRPSGMLKHKRLPDTESESAIRALVEAAIRDRVGVS